MRRFLFRAALWFVERHLRGVCSREGHVPIHCGDPECTLEHPPECARCSGSLLATVEPPPAMKPTTAAIVLGVLEIAAEVLRNPPSPAPVRAPPRPPATRGEPVYFRPGVAVWG